MLKRQFRDIETHFPWLPPFKYGALNFLSPQFGLRIDRDFRILSKLGPIRLALDIGANWGQSVVALRHTCRPDKIISFEPNPDLAARLARTYSGDSSIQIEACALSDVAGGFKLYIPHYRNFRFDPLASINEEDCHHLLSPRHMARFDPAKMTIHSVDVPLKTLDSYGLAPDVVKIDVQGLEHQVVKGGIKTFTENRPITIIEAPPEELVALFATLDMKAHYFDGENLSPYNWQWKNAVFLTEDHVSRFLAQK